MVPGEPHLEWQAVVQVGKGNPVLGPHWLPDDDLVDVIELIPVVVAITTEPVTLGAVLTPPQP